jgi:TolB-like protein/DNA-binding winged helix-turn-helix (wHTH) protein/Flp pilus assembly protein TadD
MESFRIGRWLVNPGEGQISQQDDVRHVRRKAMDVLLVLAETPNIVVEREVLLNKVWGERAVSDEPLTSTIAELRRLLDDGSDHRYIETVPKRGYRLSAPGETEEVAADLDSERGAQPARQQPSIRIRTTGVVALCLLVFAIILTALQLNESETPPIHSVAVLPFDDLSAQKMNAYLAEGLAEELTATLTQIPRLRTAARSSAFQFSLADTPAADIAEQLRVRYLLSGSIRVVDDKMRVTAQLLDTSTGYQVWSKQFDRDLADIFQLQADIARLIAGELEVNILGKGRMQSQSSEAYRLYLQARYIGRQHTRESFEEAQDLYRRAIKLDPEFVPALTELSGLQVNMVGYSLLPRDEGYQQALELAERAQALNPEYAPVYDRLGWIALFWQGDLKSAANHYQRALTLAPNNHDVASNAAVLAIALGRLEDAIELFRAVTLVDTVSPVSYANLSYAYFLHGSYVLAEQHIRKALALSPQYAAGHYRLAQILLVQERLDEAAAALDKETFDAAKNIGLAMLLADQGDEAGSDAAIDKVIQAYGHAAAGNIAQAYGHRGDVEKALYWLELEFTTNGKAGFLEYRFDPSLQLLHADPRWEDLMQRMGIDAASLKTIEFRSPKLKTS